MLFGTSLLFRISYFITSFSPAFFLLSLNFRKEQLFCTKYGLVNHVLSFMFYWLFPITVMLVTVFAAIYIKRYLSKRKSIKTFEISNKALNFNEHLKKFKKSKTGYVIQVQKGVKVNSGFIAFTLSVVTPSVVLALSNEAQFLSSLLVSIMFFLLLMMSNDVFPNIILPIFGVHLMVTADSYNVFYLSSQKDFLSGVKKLNSLGNTGSLARTYILSDENYADNEMEDVATE